LPELQGKELEFKNMYHLIPCSTIEHVGLKKGVDLWFDEEGMFKNPILNSIATKFYRQAYPHIPAEDLGIVGNAILTDNTKAGDFIK